MINGRLNVHVAIKGILTLLDPVLHIGSTVVCFHGLWEWNKDDHMVFK